MPRIFNREEVMRPLTLAVLVVIVVLVIVIRVRNNFTSNQDAANEENITSETFQQMVDAYYPSTEEIQNSKAVSITSRKRASESIHFIARDGFFVQGYVSKPEGIGPFPPIIIVPDVLSGSDALTVSQVLGELYATTLQAAVIVVDPRATHRGVDDVTDVIAAIEWTPGVQELDAKPQFVVGIGYGAWLAAKASATTAPEHLIMLSPVLDFSSENVKTTLRSSFIAQSDCETVASQDACFAQLSSVTLPIVPTYVQLSSNEMDIRAQDIALINAAGLMDFNVETITGDISLRTASAQSNAPILTSSLQQLSTWFTPYLTTQEIE